VRPTATRTATTPAGSPRPSCPPADTAVAAPSADPVGEHVAPVGTVYAEPAHDPRSGMRQRLIPHRRQVVVDAQTGEELFSHITDVRAVQNRPGGRTTTHVVKADDEAPFWGETAPEDTVGGYRRVPLQPGLYPRPTRATGSRCRASDGQTARRVRPATQSLTTAGDSSAASPQRVSGRAEPAGYPTGKGVSERVSPGGTPGTDGDRACLSTESATGAARPSKAAVNKVFCDRNCKRSALRARRRQEQRSNYLSPFGHPFAEPRGR
jgi:hypothetical protein